MAREPQPGKILAALDHQGRRYELAEAVRDWAAFLTCIDAGGQAAWRRILKTPELEVMTGNLRVEDDRLVAHVGGEHSRGGTEYGWIFTVTTAGDVVKSSEMKS